MNEFQQFRANLGPFRPRRWPTIGTFAVVFVLMGLCVWQIQRDGERNRHWQISKTAWSLSRLSVVPETSEVHRSYFREVALEGEFVPPIMLEGGHDASGVAGYGVFQSFETVGGARVLVLRGSVRRPEVEEVVDRLKNEPPNLLRGQIRPLSPSKARPPIEVEGLPPIWGRGNVLSIHTWAGALQPDFFVIAGEREDETSPRLSNGLVSMAYGPPVRDNTSLHFAKQWFALAIIFVLIWIWISFEAHQRRSPET
jgi:cytochrome oxidase assembly protein ShyY1